MISTEIFSQPIGFFSELWEEFFNFGVMTLRSNGKSLFLESIWADWIDESAMIFTTWLSLIFDIFKFWQQKFIETHRNPKNFLPFKRLQDTWHLKAWHLKAWYTYPGAWSTLNLNSHVFPNKIEEKKQWVKRKKNGVNILVSEGVNAEPKRKVPMRSSTVEHPVEESNPREWWIKMIRWTMRTISWLNTDQLSKKSKLFITFCSFGLHCVDEGIQNNKN